VVNLTGGLGNDTYSLATTTLAGSAITDTGGTDTLVFTGATSNTLTLNAGATFAAIGIDQIVAAAGVNTVAPGQIGAQTINMVAGGTGTPTFTLGAAGALNLSTATFTAIPTATLPLTAAGAATAATVAVTALTLNGTATADTITGSALADNITGGGGLDVLTGNAGNDVFVSTAILATDAVNITDFTTAADDFDFNGALLNGTVVTAVAAAGATLAAVMNIATNTVFVINLAANNAALTTAVTNYLASKTDANADLVEAAAIVAIGADVGLDTDLTALESVLIAVDNNHTDGVGESMVFRLTNTTAAGNVIDAGELTLIGILGTGDLVVGDFV
jgi:hypothetical protein